MLKNCYAPAYWFVFAASQAKERSSYDVFSRNRSVNTRRLGTKRPGICFEVAIHNELGLRNGPRKTDNSDRPTNNFAKNCGASKTGSTRHSNLCGNNSKTMNSASSQ